MRFNELSDWLEWQSGLHIKSIDLGLERSAAVWMNLLEQLPDRTEAVVITVAGTNGKGSSIAFLEAILLSAGYSVGTYTSPHLLAYNERIRINGIPVDEPMICQAFEAIDQARGEISLSYFEFSTLAALYLFYQQTVEVMLLEVGLGGRLDAVNIVDADVALITGIDLDHQDWLGDTREAIGYEKAGIFRPARPAIFGGKNMPDSIARHAREIQAELSVAGQDFTCQKAENAWHFRYRDQNRYALPFPGMRGAHQLENATAVLAVLAAIEQKLPVSQQAIRNGLQVARVDARFQVIQDQVPVIIDVAHNPQAIGMLCNNLHDFPVSGKTHLIFGLLSDKDAGQMIAMLSPLCDFWYTVDTEGDRGLSAMQLAQQVEKDQHVQSRVVVCSDVEDACHHVFSKISPNDRIVVCGSFIVAGQMLARYDLNNG